jgi:hypothetical protein
LVDGYKVTLDRSLSVHKSVSKGPQTESRKNTQANWQGLSALDRSGNGASGKDNRCKKGELSAIGGTILDAKTTKNVLVHVNHWDMMV